MWFGFFHYIRKECHAKIATLGGGMISSKFLTGRGRERLSSEERTLIEEGIANVQTVRARKILVRRGESVFSSMLVVEGFICRCVNDSRGARQIVSLHVPGDFVDLDSFKLKRLAHDIVTIGPAKIATFSHDTLQKLTERSAHLANVLWHSSLLEAAIHREWIFRLGRLEAEARAAHFFCELHARLGMVSLVQNGSFELPLTQPDLGDILSLTAVHTNRVLRSLRVRGLLTFRNRQVEIHDKIALARLGNFDPAFLYASPPNKYLCV